MAYFANSSEGSYLENQCDLCLVNKKDDVFCPIYDVHMLFNYDQCNKGQEKLRECLETLINKNGDCQMFKIFEEYKLNREE